jgi:putative flavoprotein involved in K+ transport
VSAALDVAVIGGGQSGLALGYHLARRGLRYSIFDASPSAGHVWRSRWDSLRLITPCPYNSLPGTPFPGAAWSFPSKDAVADYLDEYERRHGLTVHHGTAVREVRRADDGDFQLALTAAEADTTATARAVVVATGAFRSPAIPSFARRGHLPQLHSHAYRRPAQLPMGDVLVVGCGNSGAGIAQDLAVTHRVTLSMGRTSRAPRALLGRDLFWWAHHLGLDRLPARSWLARRIQAGPDGLIGLGPEALARRHRFALAPRTLDLEGDQARFADGSRRRFDAVVWATGYRPDYPMLAGLAGAPAAAPLFDGRGAPVHRGGLSSILGLGFLGLPWQRHIDSSLLGGVGRDASHLADDLARHLARARAARATVRAPLASSPEIS